MAGNLIKTVVRYLGVWLKTSSYSVQVELSTRGASLMYIAGKFIRFFFFLWLLLIVGGKLQKIAGYTLDQMITFFLIFNLYDIIGQTFFRGIYTLRGEIISGSLDFRLMKPLNGLFQVLTTNTDTLDMPLVAVILLFLWRQNLSVSFQDLILFLLISLAAFVLILAIHTIVAGVGILSTEVDNLVMIYRDLSTMARVPIDIYIDPIRALLTFIVPVGIIMTFPAKALLGLLTWQAALFSLIGSLIFLLISLRFWNFALKQYSSASS